MKQQVVPFRKNTPSPPREPSPAQPLRPAALKVEHAELLKIFTALRAAYRRMLLSTDLKSAYPILKPKVRATLCEVYRKAQRGVELIESISQKDLREMDKASRGTIFEVKYLMKDTMALLENLGVDGTDDAVTAARAAGLKEAKAKLADIDKKISKVAANSLQVQAGIDRLKNTLRLN